VGRRLFVLALPSRSLCISCLLLRVLRAFVVSPSLPLFLSSMRIHYEGTEGTKGERGRMQEGKEGKCGQKALRSCPPFPLPLHLLPLASYYY